MFDFPLGNAKLSSDRARDPRDAVCVAAGVAILRVNGLRKSAYRTEEQFTKLDEFAERIPSQQKGDRKKDSGPKADLHCDYRHQPSERHLRSKTHGDVWNAEGPDPTPCGPRPYRRSGYAQEIVNKAECQASKNDLGDQAKWIL